MSWPKCPQTEKFCSAAYYIRCGKIVRVCEVYVQADCINLINRKTGKVPAVKLVLNTYRRNSSRHSRPATWGATGQLPPNKIFKNILKTPINFSAVRYNNKLQLFCSSRRFQLAAALHHGLTYYSEFDAIGASKRKYFEFRERLGRLNSICHLRTIQS